MPSSLVKDEPQKTNKDIELRRVLCLVTKVSKNHVEVDCLVSNCAKRVTATGDTGENGDRAYFYTDDKGLNSFHFSYFSIKSRKKRKTAAF